MGTTVSRTEGNGKREKEKTKTNVQNKVVLYRRNGSEGLSLYVTGGEQTIG